MPASGRFKRMRAQCSSDLKRSPADPSSLLPQPRHRASLSKEMPIHRDYYVPGEEGARPIWHLSYQSEKKYPEDLKTACRKGASSRLPISPDRCPHCDRPTGFWAQLCYMEGVAGAYAFVVCYAASCYAIQAELL